MDHRLVRRLGKLTEKVVDRKSIVIHRIADNEAEQRAYYRLLQNECMTEQEISKYIIEDCRRQVNPGQTYLVFQDTTQPSFESNRQNITPGSGLGVLSDDRTLGFFLHPGLVLESDTHRSIGYSYIQTWSRNGEKLKCRERSYKEEPIEDKESYRWLQCVKQSREVLSQAGSVVVVSDREGEIFEVLDRLPDPDTHVLVRAKNSRMMLNERGERERLGELLTRQPIAGIYNLTIKQDARKKRLGRRALMEVRYASAGLVFPKRLGSGTEQLRTMYLLEVKESPESCPVGERPIHWLLITSWPITSMENALQVIDWYKGRWNAEQVFRLSKRKGLNIEESKLETGSSIIKMSMLALFAASKIITLHQASKKEEPVAIEKTFTVDQKECLKAVGQDMEGKTQKQKNPYQEDSLQWVYWILSRLGGWKPHEKQAGVITIFRGWQRFNQIFKGWLLARNVS